METDTIYYQDLSLMDYQQAWDYQEKIFDTTVQQKAKNRASEQKTATQHNLLFCEHPHVFTLGKSGDQSNLLINEDLLAQKGAKFYKINRGGDITYHGPGQIVGYPILDLETLGIGMKEYIFKLEESVIETLKHFHVEASRLEGATGVWLDPEDPIKARKICAIGVRASRFVTMHGFAFNVNTDLSFYNLINPCGFTDKGVTSMKKELGRKTDIDIVKGVLLEKFAHIFGLKIKSAII
jgi:lipoyl(octanoyl) transferase